MDKDIQEFCKRILPAVQVGASGDGEVYVSISGKDVLPMPLVTAGFYEGMDYSVVNDKKSSTRTGEPKHDGGKIIAGTVLRDFSLALKEVCKVGTFGAEKYSAGSWSKVTDAFNRYDNADMRHYLDRCAGIEFDEESRLPHLAHEAWNALAKLELYMRESKGNGNE